jgi:VIT1/CCC1 family predicted Fe2+/Mn2+ transporter
MNGPATRIVVTDLRIPFFRLVMFFVKAALAAIPAAIILAVLAMVLTVVLAALLGGETSWMIQRWRL